MFESLEEGTLVLLTEVDEPRLKSCALDVS
jgi:hypothetical protein